MISPIIIQNLMRNNYDDEMEGEEMSYVSKVFTVRSLTIENLIKQVNEDVENYDIYADVSFMYDDKTQEYVAFLICKNK